MAEMDLTGWVERARRGDRAAFERVVGLTARAVYAQVVGMVRDRQKAEDVVQETFVAAWKGMGGLENGAGFIGWLMTLARNKVRDGVKREQRIKRGGAGLGDGGAAVGLRAGATKGQGEKESGVGVEEVADGGMEPGVLVERTEARERMLRVLAELPEEYRRVLEMRYLGGAEYEVIREALGMTDGALRGVLNRGMAMLRERMSLGESRRHEAPRG